MEYKTIPCEEDDEELIEEKLDAINRSILPSIEDGEEELVFKIADDEGNIIAGCVLEIDCWRNAELDILWVDESHRRNGLGSALIRKAEKTARERCYFYGHPSEHLEFGIRFRLPKYKGFMAYRCFSGEATKTVEDSFAFIESHICIECFISYDWLSMNTVAWKT